MDEIPSGSRCWLVLKIAVGHLVILPLHVYVFLHRVAVKVKLRERVVVACDCDDNANDAAVGELKAIELHEIAGDPYVVRAIKKDTTWRSGADRDVARADADHTVLIPSIGQDNLVASDSAIHRRL